MNDDSQNWERTLLEKLAVASLDEQRRSRHWKIFFRLMWLLITLLIVFSVIFSSTTGQMDKIKGSHTAVITLNGVIDSNQNISNKLITGIKNAYKDKNTKAIIIRANSPGGSPVLSGQAFDEIRRLRKIHQNIPVYTVVEEMCASGCYYIAAATDKIFVDKASMIGSIGVLSNGFGFVGTMEKLGIERRLTISGNNKAMGDPFSPINPEQEVIFKTMLDEVHQQFIDAVKLGRAKRLKNDPDIFSGRVYLGSQGNKLGLSDGFGSVDSVARDIIKAEQIKDFTPEDDLSQRFAKKFGVSVGDGLRSLLETKLM